MKRLWDCRRSFLAFCGIIASVFIAKITGLDTSMAVALICGGIGAVNMLQKGGSFSLNSKENKIEKNPFK